MDVQMIVRRKIMEISSHFAMIKIPLVLDCLQAFFLHWLQHWKVFSSQISHSPQVFLNWQDETIQCPYVTLIKLPILFKYKFVILEDDVFLFFFTAKNRVDPVAVWHVHGVYKFRLDDVIVKLSCLSYNLELLLGIFCNQSVTGRIYQVTLDLRDFFWTDKPKLAEFIVVEVLLSFLNKFLRHWIVRKLCFTADKNRISPCWIPR